MNLEREVALSSDGGRVVATTKALQLHDAFDKDVCMEILIRLPIKSLIKFQIVCKQWLSLISSNHFRRLHTLRHHHQPPPCVILTTPDPSLCHFNLIRKPTVMIPFHINIPRWSKLFYHRIFCSCNGLVILHSIYDNHFHVCNPITRHSRKISLSHSDSYRRVKMLHLVFDPNKSLHYKIVCIRAKEQTYKIEIFDSENGSWKACMEPITISSLLGFTNSVYCNNKIYIIEYYTCEGSIYCIDINKNVVRLMTSPIIGMPERISYGESIQEMNGCVYYSALLYSFNSGQWACVWEKSELEDDKWLLKHKDILHCPAAWLVSTQLRFIPQTSTLLILIPPRTFMAYSFLEKSCNKLLSLQERDDEENINVFHQTLASV